MIFITFTTKDANPWKPMGSVPAPEGRERGWAKCAPERPLSAAAVGTQACSPRDAYSTVHAGEGRQLGEGQAGRGPGLQGLHMTVYRPAPGRGRAVSLWRWAGPVTPSCQSPPPKSGGKATAVTPLSPAGRRSEMMAGPTAPRFHNLREEGSPLVWLLGTVLHNGKVRELPGISL